MYEEEMPADASLKSDKSQQLSLDSDISERIVRAATNAFLQCGYERTTLDGVAKAARVSKTAIYEHFGDKATLFKAALDWALVPVVEGQPRFSSDARRPQPVLEDISRWIYNNFMRPDNLGLYRVNIEVAAHFPDLAGVLNDYRQQRGSTGVASYLKQLSGAGAIAIEDHNEASRWIGVLSVGGTYHLMGGKPLEAAEQDARACAAAGLFLGGAAAVAAAIDPPPCERPAESAPRPQMRLAGDRHRLLLASAAEEFTARGFRGANIDRLVTETGISKMTIRRHHGNKAGLYRAAMKYRAATHAFRVALPGNSSPQDVLMHVGIQVINQAFDPERVRFQQAIIADATRDPTTARMTYDLLGDDAVSALAGYFRTFGLAQPATVARQFLILSASGNLALLGEQPPVPANRQHYMRCITALVLGKDFPGDAA